MVVQEAAISSADLDLDATVAVQAAVIAELRAANAEQARLIATLQGGWPNWSAAWEGLLQLLQAAILRRSWQAHAGPAARRRAG